MNENDLRDCFAMFALVGYIQKYGEGFMANDVWETADAMLEARKEPKQESGIAAFKPKRNTAKKVSDAK